MSCKPRLLKQSLGFNPTCAGASVSLCEGQCGQSAWGWEEGKLFHVLAAELGSLVVRGACIQWKKFTGMIHLL